jgi:hypothetical protein
MKGGRVEVFASAASAAKALALFAGSFALPCADLTPEDIARESADGAWPRSLARKSPGGSELYRRWASENVPRMAKSARYVINQEQFDKLVRRTATDLLRSWREISPDHRARLSLGAAFRAVDLLFLAINESEACRASQIQALLHVPLDGTTLRPLRQCIDELVDREFAIEIPAAISAGFVATEEHYDLFQEAIFALAERAGVPPIVYAYFCAASARASPS